MSEHHSVIIIGAGLSGLYTAWRLRQQQHDVQLHDVLILEARDRTGGRILSPQVTENSNSGIDLGAGWSWPQLQPRLEHLFNQLDVKLFKQFTSGDILYEMKPDAVERYTGPSSHQQSYRIVNGGETLIEALGSRLPAASIQLNSEVVSIQHEPSEIKVMRNGASYLYSADNIILALPPRIASNRISFHPALTDNIQQAWERVSTWMAAQCKIVFIYDVPFWRKQNLSGEVFSQHGPLTELYDASAADESFYALTSFVGISAVQRQALDKEQLIELCMQQLHRLFGDESHHVRDIQIKDWSTDIYTSTDIDINRQAAHPQYPESMPPAIWDQHLILAGTEVAQSHAGYLEGALVSADVALSLLGVDDFAIQQKS